MTHNRRDTTHHNAGLRASAAAPYSTLWHADGVATHSEPLRLALLGDSRANLTAALALSLSATAKQPVHVTDAAVFGARSRDLAGQLDAVAATGRPHVAVVVIGAGDVARHCSATDAVRLLTLAVHRLDVLGARVVVGTCTELAVTGGTVASLSHPILHRSARHARSLGYAQAAAVRSAGGVAVNLCTPPGTPTRGTATAAGFLLRAICATLGLAAPQSRRPHAA